MTNLPWDGQTPFAVKLSLFGAWLEVSKDLTVDLVESGQVKPCKTIDLGYGAGNYATYLASRGFDVTGVDISPSAIALARESAKKKGEPCNFVVADLLEGLSDFTATFEFAHEWSVSHHVYPESSKRHVETVHRMLVPGLHSASTFAASPEGADRHLEVARVERDNWRCSGAMREPTSHRELLSCFGAF